ncbi:MAG TPA: hypothetical protein VI386_06150, partial [Candidatus Sulfotelmatobacter sp.]
MRNQQGKNESLLQLRVRSGLGLRLLFLYLSVALSPTIYAQQTFGPAAVESDLPNSPGSELPSPQSATATISGTVRDINGGIVLEAKATL